MSYERKCSHSKTFKTRCIDCELIMARERVTHAKQSFDQYSKLVAKLEAEMAMQISLATLEPEIREFKNSAGKDRTMLMKPGSFPDYR